MAGQTTGNPAVVGLAGFGMTTLLLQFHNLGWCGSGIVFCTALAFGGGAQLIAGFQEFKAGNNFGYSAFVSMELSGSHWRLCSWFWTCSTDKSLLSAIILKFRVRSGNVSPRIHALYGNPVDRFVCQSTPPCFLPSSRCCWALSALIWSFWPDEESADHNGLGFGHLCSACMVYDGTCNFLQVFGRDILPVGKPLVAKPA